MESLTVKQLKLMIDHYKNVHLKTSSLKRDQLLDLALRLNIIDEDGKVNEELFTKPKKNKYKPTKIVKEIEEEEEDEGEYGEEDAQKFIDNLLSRKPNNKLLVYKDNDEEDEKSDNDEKDLLPKKVKKNIIQKLNEEKPKEKIIKESEVVKIPEKKLALKVTFNDELKLRQLNILSNVIDKTIESSFNQNDIIDKDELHDAIDEGLKVSNLNLSNKERDDFVKQKEGVLNGYKITNGVILQKLNNKIKKS